MDKQKQIEEMAKDLYRIQTYAIIDIYPCAQKQPNELVAEHLVRWGYCKIPEGAVVLTEKEYKRYERIEKTIRLAKMYKALGFEVKNGKLYYYSNLLEGCEIEFKNLQEICDMANHYLEEFCSLDQRISYWQGEAKTIKKKMVDKFAERAKEKVKERYKLLGSCTCYGDIEYEIDEICKEITEGKV